MPSELTATLAKLALPLLPIGIVLVVTRARRITWTDELRLIHPPVPQALLWIAVWLAWMIVAELLIGVLGLPAPDPWQVYPPAIFALRILAIGVLGPVAEELVFRGILYYRLSQTRMRHVGAIALPALFWALIHVQYEAGYIVLIFLDGIMFGLARYRTRSVFTPMVMHIIGNLFAIWQAVRF